MRFRLLQLVAQNFQNDRLLLGSSVDEGFRKQALGSRVDIGEAVEEKFAFVVGVPVGDDQVDEFVDAHCFRAGGVGLRNEQFGHGGDRGVLVGSEDFELRGSRQAAMDFAESAEEFAGNSGNRGAQGEELQDFASMQTGPPEKISVLCVAGNGNEKIARRCGHRVKCRRKQCTLGAVMKLKRREFIAAGAATAVLSRLAMAAEARLPLAFSTLGCPTWEWKKILEFAQANGFAAVELRGLDGQSGFAVERGIFARKYCSGEERHCGIWSENRLRQQFVRDARSGSRKAETDAGGCAAIHRSGVGAGSAYVRVFGNKIEGPKEEVVARVAAGLHELAEYSGPKGVTVIVESHGDFTDSPTLKQILTMANSRYAGLLWDAHHTFVSSHEAPELTVKELGP